MDRAKKHKNGAFYTPETLADYLLSRCPDKRPRRVLDPACGEFSLLIAARKRYGLKDDMLIGCDKQKIKKGKTNFSYFKSDFFKLDVPITVDLIVTNPPYIKGDKCPRSFRKWYEQQHLDDVHISKRADSWVYFLLKCIDHLADHGNLAAILPWSFFQSDYSIVVRKYLANVFAEIDAQILTLSHFDDTHQKVVCIWLYDKGANCKTVKTHCSDEMAKSATNTRFRRVEISQWIDGSAFRDAKIPALENKFCFLLGDFCDVKIGLVPGATKFFVRTQEQIEALGLQQDDVVPIITRSRTMQSLDSALIPDREVRYVLKITDANLKKFTGEIAEGERAKYDERRHCQNRSTWYSIEFPSSCPDAFFTYRASSVPLMMLNSRQYECTNAIHRVFFKDKALPEDRKRWIQLSLLSAYSLCDLELKARTYGKNVLKIEPTALKSVHVFCPDDRIDYDVVENIDHLLAVGKREDAVNIATDYILSAMHLAASKKAEIIGVYKKLKAQRMGINA